MSKRSFYKQTTSVSDTATATILEVEKPAKFTLTSHTVPSNVSPARLGVWVLLTGCFLLLSILTALGLLGRWYWLSFESTIGTSIMPILQTMWQRKDENIFAEKPIISILLLGLDQSMQVRENSMLTDTIVIATIKENGSIDMFSLPRDLWIDSLKTRINALYYYGQQNNANESTLLLTSVVADITGIPIDYYAMVNMDTITAMIDAVGGVTVTVDRPFQDKLYPREVDLTSIDPKVLYETVTFAAGPQHFTGTQALKFIRSRHSEDPFEGTDAGRELRQQKLLTALMQKISDLSIFTNPKTTGSLYSVWKNNIRTNLDDITLFLIAKQLMNTPFAISQHSLPEKTEEQAGIIYHPKQGPGKQWVYMPVDPSWKELRAWIQARINDN